MMNAFIRYLCENAGTSKTFDKTVAICAGSYKPPTAAHWYMIEEYTKQADEVIVLISDPKTVKSVRKTSAGTVITPAMSKQIFEIYAKRYGLSNVVKIVVSPSPSPVTAMFEYVDNNLSDVNVIFGVSKKGGDENRFKSAVKYYADKPHVNLIDPIETAVEPYADQHGNPISATDVRNNIENADVIKQYLPSKLTSDDIAKVVSILSDGINESITPVDEYESVHIMIDDAALAASKINCYNVGQETVDSHGKDCPYNPKKFPHKAIDINTTINQIPVEIYFDTDSKKWDSNLKYGNVEGKLSLEQFEQFFNTSFYAKLINLLKTKWPLSDTLYSELFNGLVAKLIQFCDDASDLTEDDEDKKDDRTETASGRKIVNFSDMGVNTKSFLGQCWPKRGDEFKYTQWADYTKIRPLCKIIFKHGQYNYALSVPVLDHDFESRGFRGSNQDLEPKLQWVTSEECQQMMKLSIVRKFIKQCIKRITKYLSIPTDEILAKVSNPDKVDKNAVEQTKKYIRATLDNVLKNYRAETYSFKKN